MTLHTDELPSDHSARILWQLLLAQRSTVRFWTLDSFICSLFAYCMLTRKYLQSRVNVDQTITAVEAVNALPVIVAATAAVAFAVIAGTAVPAVAAIAVVAVVDVFIVASARRIRNLTKNFVFLERHKLQQNINIHFSVHPPRYTITKGPLL